MLPILLVSNDQKHIDEYIESLKQKYAISDHSLYQIHPEKTEFTIGQIRQLKQMLIMHSGTKRLVVLHSFQKASVEAQNALLKTLEEQTEQNLFLLCADSQNAVLPTIRSRVVVVSFHEESNQTDTFETLMRSIQSGDDWRFLEQFTGVTREEAVVYLDQTLLFLRTQYSVHPLTAAKLASKALEYKKLLLYNNLNPQLVVDNYFLLFQKQLQNKK